MAVGNDFSALDAEAQLWQVSKPLLCKMLFLETCHLGSVPEVFKRKAKKLAHFMEDFVFESEGEEKHGISVGFKEI